MMMLFALGSVLFCVELSSSVGFDFCDNEKWLIRDPIGADKSFCQFWYPLATLGNGTPYRVGEVNALMAVRIRVRRHTHTHRQVCWIYDASD
uniref:Putative secreted protein n=1 Tax=Anopheles darlingi TaxID=43151 RepID=A0A2M4DR46_ANODA